MAGSRKKIVKKVLSELKTGTLNTKQNGRGRKIKTKDAAIAKALSIADSRGYPGKSSARNRKKGMTKGKRK